MELGGVDSHKTGEKTATKPVKSDRKRRRTSSLWLHKPKRTKVCEVTGKKEQNKESTPLNLTVHAKPDSEQLLRAPSKPERIKVKGKKRLFDESVTEKLINEIQNLVPSFLKELESANLLHDFCKLLRLLSVGKFPTKNIAFLLFLDVVRWYSLVSTTQMIYREDTMKFWRVMYRLFHGKALRFMSGIKSTGQVVTEQSEKGHYDPQTSKMNFAVPDQNTIAQFKTTEVNIPTEVSPGIINQAIEMKDKQKNYVLTVDGKKLAPGLSREKGDIDLFGHEETDSLQSTKERLNLEIDAIESMKDNWSILSDDGKICAIGKNVLLISKRVQDLRNVFVKQSLALKRFEKEAGTDWRNSKYVFAISSVQAMIYQLKSMVRRLLDINNSLLEIGASINNASSAFRTSGSIDAFTQENWVSLKEPEDLPDNKNNMNKFIKQRSPVWFDMRSKFPVTGSRLFEALGLDTLKNMHKHMGKLLNPGQEEEPIPDIVKERMEHGTKSEINAVATLVGKIMPFYFPDCTFIEEGSHVIKRGEKSLMLISPDGSIGHLDKTGTECPRRLLGCEFKCPVSAVYKTPTHYDIPLRYIPQVLGEMASMNVSELIYLCWTDESSTVFRVTFDSELWTMIETEAEKLYLAESLKKPTRISDEAKSIKEKLKNFSENHVKFMCEVPSLRGTSSQMSQTTDVSPYLFPIPVVGAEQVCLDTIENVLTSASTALKDVFQLCRKKATEVLVWLLSDTDRHWNPEVPHSLPIAYAMKGYSLASETMRHMHSHILEVCHKNGLDIVCSCFDGQWVRLATRDGNNKPLTELQLQRDVWDTATKTQRNVIVNELATASIVRQLTTDVDIVKHTDGTLYVRCDRLANIMASIRNVTKRKNADKTTEHNEEQCEDESTVDTLSCLPDEALETIIQTDGFVADLLIPQSQEHNAVEQGQKDNMDGVDISGDCAVTEKSKLTENVPDDIFVNILRILQTHQKSSVSSKWNGKSLPDLKNTINDSLAVHTLTHDELNVMIKETEMVQTKNKFYVRKSWRRAEKANGICKLIGSGEEITVEITVKKVFTLKECASKVVMANSKTIKKSSLNNAYAASIYQEYYNKWISESTFSAKTNIQGIGPTKWFSYPEFNEERKRLEPKCLDAHHLLVNVRVKVCKDGVKDIKKDAWHAVAESDSNIINKA